MREPRWRMGGGPLARLPRPRLPPADRTAYLSAAALGVATIVVFGFRLSAAPDVFGDEAAYTLVGKHLAAGQGLVDVEGPFLWHPPLYFAIEAAFLKLGGLTQLDVLSTIFVVRWLNVVAAGATAAVLVLFGYRIRSLRAGVLMGVIFLLDPYVQRIDRRAMLETLVMLLVLLGLFIFVTGRTSRHPVRRWLGSGLVLGLAVLTKEPAAAELLVLLGFAVWARRDQLWDVARTGATAAGVYLVYPAAMLAVGWGADYGAYKLYNLERVAHSMFGFALGQPPRGGPLQSAPRAFTAGNLQQLLPDYGSSYLLMAFVVVGLVVLVLRFRHVAGAQFLVVWAAFSLAAGAVLVRVSDQYVYFVIVPCIMVCGYLLDAAFSRLLRGGLVREGPRRVLRVSRGRLAAALSVALLAAFGVNAHRWFVTYGVGTDDGYTQVVHYVYGNVPRGQVIVSSDEVASYLLTPDYTVRLDRSPSVIVANDERYFILSSKDRWAGNQGTTPAFYDWAVANSRPLFTTYDSSYWVLGVYERVR